MHEVKHDNLFHLSHIHFDLHSGYTHLDSITQSQPLIPPVHCEVHAQCLEPLNTLPVQCHLLISYILFM